MANLVPRSRFGRFEEGKKVRSKKREGGGREGGGGGGGNEIW